MRKLCALLQFGSADGFIAGPVGTLALLFRYKTLSYNLVNDRTNMCAYIFENIS